MFKRLSRAFKSFAADIIAMGMQRTYEALGDKLDSKVEALRAQTVRDLQEASQEKDVRIDVPHVIAQLTDQSVASKLRHYVQWNNRLIELLNERNKRAARDTYDFIDANMQEALFWNDQFHPIKENADEILRLGGAILDLGVYKGGSTRSLCRIFPDKDVHGFDSFEGLPVDWSHAPKGQFGEIKGVLPDLPDNAKLYKGWFDDTLPQWAANYDKETIALLRVDCDIYSSTKVIFDTLGDKLVVGSYILFDELIGYYGFRHHELKAFMEFIERTGFRYEYLAYGLTYTLVRLTDREEPGSALAPGKV